MGKASRDKGARVERALVEALKQHGWQEVLRVPLSGAAAGFKGDVHARPPGWGTSLVFENKARAKGFEKYYALLRPNRPFKFSTGKEECVMSLNPADVVPGPGHFPFMGELTKEQASVLKLKDRWLGDADILTLKQDRMPFIYIRFSK